MKKKLLSLFLALTLALSLAAPAWAATPEEAQDSAQLLYNLGLFQGSGTNEDGSPRFALERAPDFVSSDHEKAWIIRTTANTCKDLLKSHWRRTTVAMEAASHIPAPELEEGSLSAAVNLLPPKYRAVIYLYYYEGYSSKEIARLLGRNPATVATQLRRGRTQLKDLLESEGSS